MSARIEKSSSFHAYDLAGFIHDIKFMNKTYNIPSPPSPEIPDPERIAKLKQILLEEVSELDDIKTPDKSYESTINYLVALGDFLADIIVYAASEARRHGLPINQILYAVMESNFSKLDSNGKPILDPVTNKFKKGPNYKPPEQRIKEIILKAMEKE